VRTSGSITIHFEVIINKTTLIKNLQAAQKHLPKIPKNPTDDDRYEIVNTITACVNLVGDTAGDYGKWVNRGNRKRQLEKLLACKGVLTNVAKVVVAELIAYTISCVEIVSWSDEFLTYALPIRYTPRIMTEEHKEAMLAARAENRAKREAARTRRLALV
jgi:hypothetical protein